MVRPRERESEMLDVESLLRFCTSVHFTQTVLPETVKVEEETFKIDYGNALLDNARMKERNLDLAVETSISLSSIGMMISS